MPAGALLAHREGGRRPTGDRLRMCRWTSHAARPSRAHRVRRARDHGGALTAIAMAPVIFLFVWAVAACALFAVCVPFGIFGPIAWLFCASGAVAVVTTIALYFVGKCVEQTEEQAC